LDVRPAGEMFRYIVKIFDLDLGIPALLRVEDDVRSFLAGAEAHVGFHFDVLDPFCRYAFFELSHELFRASRLAIDVLTHKTHPLH
jgi:hypothetical protein